MDHGYRRKRRCSTHHSTRVPSTDEPSGSRKRKRLSTGLPWIICQHRLGLSAWEQATWEYPETSVSTSEDASDEVLRSIEAALALGDGEPEFILSLPVIESIAGIMYRLLRSDDATCSTSAMLRRLRLIVAKQRRER